MANRPAIFFLLHLSVDGGWSAWVPNGPCSAACGSGLSSFTRNCTNRAPANGGLDCVGDATKSDVCQRTNCTGVSHVVSTVGAGGALCVTYNEARARLD